MQTTGLSRRHNVCYYTNALAKTGCDKKRDKENETQTSARLAHLHFDVVLEPMLVLEKCALNFRLWEF